LVSCVADNRAAVIDVHHQLDEESDDDDSVVSMEVERLSDAELQNDALVDLIPFAIPKWLEFSRVFRKLFPLNAVSSSLVLCCWLISSRLRMKRQTSI